MAKSKGDSEWWIDRGLKAATELVYWFLARERKPGDELTAAEKLFKRTYEYYGVIGRNGFGAIPERHWQFESLINDFDAIEAWGCSGPLRRVLDHFPNGATVLADPEDGWKILRSMGESHVEELERKFWNEERAFHLALIKLWQQGGEFPHVP